MTKSGRDSMEILIGDLIFKLGKANQQIHTLSLRIAKLEHQLQDHPTNQFSISKSQTFPEKRITQ